MKDISEIESACDRAADMQAEASMIGSRYPGMSYEEGVREALDWVCDNVDEDPTNPEE